MNNHRLLAVLLATMLPGAAVCTYADGPCTVTLEQIFEYAETHSVQLRPAIAAESEAKHDISVARTGKHPDINASLSVSYIGDGFTTNRRLGDYQSAPIPHLGTGLSINITQPIYAGGAINAAIDIAELKSTAARYTTELQRNNLRLTLAGYYLDLYKCDNLRIVVEKNLASARLVYGAQNEAFDGEIGGF